MWEGHIFQERQYHKGAQSQQMPVKDVTPVPYRQVLHINYIFYIILHWLSNLILLFISYVLKPKLIKL